MIHPLLSNYFFNPTGCREIKIRSDKWGDGSYGARRKKATGEVYAHRGVDLLCIPGQNIYAPFDSVYERIVYPYSDNFEYTGALLRSEKAIVKMLYFKPGIKEGTRIKKGTVIGKAQDVSRYYCADDTLLEERMKPHIHFEIVGFDPVLLF